MQVKPYDPITNDPDAPGIPVDLSETTHVALIVIGSIILLLAVAWAVRAIFRRREFRSLLAPAIAPYRGRIPMFPILNPFPPAYFRLGRREGCLSFVPFTLETPSLTRFTLPLEIADLGRFRLSSRTLQDETPQKTDSFRSGDAELDRLYAIQARDHELVRRFLTPEVIGWLRTLQWKIGSDDVFLEVNSSRFIVQKRGILNDDRELGMFIDLSLKLTEHLFRVLGGPAMSFAHSAPLSAAGFAIVECISCRRPILKDARFCASCSAPHHATCWDAFAQCSTFSCAEKNYTPRPVA